MSGECDESRPPFGLGWLETALHADLFRLKKKDYITIPSIWHPIKFYSITFEGWNHFSLDANDKTFKEIMKLVSKNFRFFIDTYKKDHVFTEPQFSFNMDSTFAIKVGTMEKKDYEKIIFRHRS